MSDLVDVTLTPTGSGYLATIDAVLGLAPITSEGATAADAASKALTASLLAVAQFAEDQGGALDPYQAAAVDWRLRSAVSAALFAVENPAPKQPAASGYGLDVSTFPDLDPTLSVRTGQRMVGEAVARRLLTRRGLLPYAPGDGLDIRDLVAQGFSQASLGTLRSQIEDEAGKDERVRTASASLRFVQGTRTLEVTVKLTTAEGPFVLVLTIGELAADIQILTR